MEAPSRTASRELFSSALPQSQPFPGNTLSSGLPGATEKRWSSSWLAQKSCHKVPVDHRALPIPIQEKSCISLAFAELLPSSQHCLWDRQNKSWLILQCLSLHRMQEKLSSMIQGFCCLPTEHGLMAFDRREKGERREDSEALNQMLQLFPCFPSKEVGTMGGIN